MLSEPCDVDLAVEMTGVAQYSSILHIGKVFFVDNLVAACHGDEEVAELRRVCHRHDIEAVHDRFDRADRIDLGDDDSCAEAFRSHRNALAAPAVACDNDDLAGDDQVGGTVDAVPHGLARAVAVVKEMFHHGVVDAHHRKCKLALAVHGFQTNDAGRGLFASADDARDQVGQFGVHHMDQITAVVDDDIRAMGQDRADV